jgi:hypothetical protein
MFPTLASRMDMDKENPCAIFHGDVPTCASNSSRVSDKASLSMPLGQSAREQKLLESAGTCTPRASRETSAMAPDSPLMPLVGIDNLRTPRTLSLAPSTPDVTTVFRSRDTPPPFVAKWKCQKPLLLQALQMDAVEHVRPILQKCPDTANEPFWDHDCELPLCCAVRLKCSSRIVELLVEFGASMESQDVSGHSPVDVARLPRPCEVQPSTRTDFPFTSAAMSLDRAIHSQFESGCLSMITEDNEPWKRENLGWLLPEEPSLPAEPTELELATMIDMLMDPNEAWKREVAAECEM